MLSLCTWNKNICKRFYDLLITNTFKTKQKHFPKFAQIFDTIQVKKKKKGKQGGSTSY